MPPADSPQTRATRRVAFALLSIYGAIFIAQLCVKLLILPLAIVASFLPRSGGPLLLPLASLVLGGFASFRLATVVARVVTRAYPPDPHPDAPAATMGRLSHLAFAMGLFQVFVFQTAESSTLRASGGAAGLSALAGFIQYALLWLFTARRARELRREGAVPRPFVLFLRRFSSYADRAVLDVALRATLRRNLSLVLLVDPKGAGGTWNPLVLGVSGGLRRGAQPMFLSTTDAQWKEVVARLIDDATCVLIDVTERSASITEELGLLTSKASASKTVVLLPRSAPVPSIHQGPALVAYARSWSRAVPRMVFGVLFVLVVVHLGPLLPGWVIATALLPHAPVLSGVVSGLLLGAGVLIWKAVFALPLLDAGSQRELETALEARAVAGLLHAETPVADVDLTRAFPEAGSSEPGKPAAAERTTTSSWGRFLGAVVLLVPALIGGAVVSQLGSARSLEQTAGLPSQAQPSDQRGEFRWEEWKPGTAIPAAGGRPTLLFFGASWSAASRAIDQTLADANVRRAAARFLAVRIEASDETEPIRAIKQEHGVSELPTIVLLDTHGVEQKRFSRYVTAAELQAELAAIH